LPPPQEETNPLEDAQDPQEETLRADRVAEEAVAEVAQAQELVPVQEEEEDPNS
jgi:hypothetical protein